ncbi:MAG: hypothetical protein JW888_04265, partial [Pirellulales bacterium]|nr:hypothetical protein [Pirellulales bacterium]
RFDQLIPRCVVVSLLPIAVVISLQKGTSPIGLVLFWSALALEESTSWLWTTRRNRHEAQMVAGPMGHDGRLGNKLWSVNRVESPVPHVGLSPSTVVELADRDGSPPGAPSATAFPWEAIPHDQVTQQFVRVHSDEGGDVFSGWLRVEMPAGTRTTNVHVAFCPPFTRTPAIEVQQVEGPPGRIKTVQALPYGARLDLKLSQSSEEVAVVLLRFVASLTEG